MPAKEETVAKLLHCFLNSQSNQYLIAVASLLHVDGKLATLWGKSMKSRHYPTTKIRYHYGAILKSGIAGAPYQEGKDAKKR